MGRPFKQYLGGPRIYACASCGTHTADVDEIVSKVGWGGGGRPFEGDGRGFGAGGGGAGGWPVPHCALPPRGRRRGRPNPISAHPRRPLTAQTRMRARARTHPLPARPQAFQGRHGRAYLLGSVVNVATGPKEDRLLITGGRRGGCGIGAGHCEAPGLPTAPNHPRRARQTDRAPGPPSPKPKGLHTVCDIHCVSCGSTLGWKYETAYETSQKYKEGEDPGRPTHPTAPFPRNLRRDAGAGAAGAGARRGLVAEARESACGQTRGPPRPRLPRPPRQVHP
jgi:hypothetical protein